MSDRLSVLHVHSGNLYGGVETLLVTLGRGANWEPSDLHRFALCYDGRLAETLRAAGAQVSLLGAVRISRPWSVARGRGRLAALLRQARPDVAVLHSPWAQVLFGGPVRRAGVPVVFCMHGAAARHTWLDRMARRGPAPNLVVANSEYTRGGAQKLFPGAPVEVCRYPVEPPPHPPDAAERAAIRRETGTGEHDVVILHAGRMEAWKGHAVLLDAVAGIGPDLPWRCWFAGGGQRESEVRYAASLHAKAAALGIADRVRFLGERRDVPRLMAAADLYCQPNVQPEPFGIVFIEALYAGLPVVAVAAGGAAEIVDASCGVLVPAGEWDRLTAGLQQLVADEGLRASLGRSGPARARLLCDPRQRLAALHELLFRAAREAASERGRRSRRALA